MMKIIAISEINYFHIQIKQKHANKKSQDRGIMGINMEAKRLQGIFKTNVAAN